ncbi:retrotransposon protein, putative, ty1-copia subclass, partial [Tanacetum coccineum]
SIFEREKLFGNNFNDWSRQLKLVLRVEKKMYAIEQPIPPTPIVDSAANVLAEWNAVYDAHNEELKSMFENQAGVERFDLIQAFHACKQEEGKPVGQYVLKMKGYVEQLERLGYYENFLSKKAATPQFMAIQGGRIQKANKKSQKAKGKEHSAKDDACHHCKDVGHWKRNCHVYLAELVMKKKQVDTVSSSGKMIRKPFPHRTERATDLLGLIHTDVCGLLRHVSIQCASYFITFMDDYSRYGYVYLLKHKHEVFGTFKVFKNEVENQLEKTIKALRSDRGGEYISQEFKDYLKSCGIVQQLTPPYTPQHNGVSERRNHTLLDMVQSMMNLTTLPLSFWDYALESDIRILNMVPTKKVDKTPYELWTVGSKWIFKKKTDMDSIVHTYKARLVAKGFTQTYGIDYEETFSSVADKRAIRVLIAIAVFYILDMMPTLKSKLPS